MFLSGMFLLHENFKKETTDHQSFADLKTSHRISLLLPKELNGFAGAFLNF